MKMMQNFRDIDIFFNDGTKQINAKNTFIYVEGEYGFIPLICGKAVEANGYEIGQIASKYQNVESFNRFPQPNLPTWRVTQTNEDTIFVAITNWFPNSDGKGEPNPSLWSNSYPVMKSLLQWLQQNGCKNVTTLTSMNILDAEKNSSVNVHDSHNDWQGKYSDEDSYLALPAWSFPWLADKMGMYGRCVVTSQDEGQFIDYEALTKTQIWLSLQGLEFDKSVTEKTIHMLMSVETEITSQGFDEDGSMGEFQ
jgi:hypothetical protein